MAIAIATSNIRIVFSLQPSHNSHLKGTTTLLMGLSCNVVSATSNNPCFSIFSKLLGKNGAKDDSKRFGRLLTNEDSP